MTKAILPCVYCGENFTQKKHSQKFCSKKCAGSSRKKDLFIECAVCHKEFKTTPCRDRINKHCSIKCRREAKRATMPGTCSCVTCGKQFEGVKDKPNHYCSTQCHIIEQRKEFRTLNCIWCKKDFTVRKNQHRIYCTQKCFFDHRRTGVYKKKITFSVCLVCKKEYESYTAHNKQYCSANCYHIAQTWPKYSGPNHPNWQGGSLYLSSRGSGWQQIRRDVIRRAKRKCEHCGMHETISKEHYKCGLHVNHKIPFHQFGGINQQANKPSNLEALCRSCHAKADWKWRKGNLVQMMLSEMFKR